ncbi:MAG: hypothetical protein RLZZ540_309 [Bacteroidota bacterium]|jgi:GT2 family glycosyltransferase
MEDKKIKILTIVVTYNGGKWINKCIDSIQRSNLPSDIYVIDNGSIDDTVSVLKKYSGIYLFESKINLGFGQANNIGLKYSLDNNYDYVFLLNQDAWVEEDTLKILYAIAFKNNDYGIISPMHHFSNEKKLEFFFSTRLSPYSCENILSDYVVKGVDNMNDVYSLNFVNAAAWLLSRKVIENIGGFDPLFFHYGEDNNYCQRLKYHNFKIGITPKTKIYHDSRTHEENQIILKNKKIGQMVLDFKINFADIQRNNVNFLSLILNVFRMFLFQSLKKIIVLDFKSTILIFGATFNCISNIGVILKSRKININLKANYLK